MLTHLKRAWSIVRTEGPNDAYRKLRRQFDLYRQAGAYRQWILEHDTFTEEECRNIGESIDRLPSKHLVSVLMPVYNVDEIWLRKAIRSVQDQIYPYWELCIADDHSTKPHVRKVLEEYAAGDGRIKIVFRETNGHISAASNSALELATGEFTALLDNDDELAKHALYMIAEEINEHSRTDMIYSDEDMIDSSGRRYGPRFKPDWSPDAFYSMNITNHLSVYRTSLLRAIGGFRVGFEGSQDYDAALRVIEKIPASNIRHIPHVLYHWRTIPGSVAFGSGEKTYAHQRARLSLNEHFKRTGVAAKSVKGSGQLHRTVYSLPEPPPLVSIILFAGERLSQTLGSILSRTGYKNYELIVVAHGFPVDVPDDRRIKVVEFEKLSKYVLLNKAAKMASGSVLVFVDNSTIVKTPDWLDEAVSVALQKEVGAVGVKLLYPNRRIKHAGLILGIRGGVGRAHHNFGFRHYGNNMRLSITQNFSAVSIDCMAIRRDVFESVDGFEDVIFPNEYGDVDLCLRLREKGYRNVWTPWAELVQSNKPGEANGIELERLRKRWREFFEKDPYYNPNLSNESDDFSLSFPPRIDKFSL